MLYVQLSNYGYNLLLEFTVSKNKILEKSIASQIGFWFQNVIPSLSSRFAILELFSTISD